MLRLLAGWLSRQDTYYGYLPYVLGQKSVGIDMWGAATQGLGRAGARRDHGISLYLYAPTILFRSPNCAHACTRALSKYANNSLHSEFRGWLELRGPRMSHVIKSSSSIARQSPLTVAGLLSLSFAFPLDERA
jgi:hypothetical protein